MAVYKIRVNTPEKIQEVDAEAVVIPSFEGFQFIVHEAPMRPGMWAVSEVTTGTSVVSYCATRKIALQAAQCALEKKGVAAIYKAIKASIKKYGVLE